LLNSLEPAFSPWASFYVIVGSSGAALTGLQFVVIALVADAKRRSSTYEIAAFGTPTVVHFSAVLYVAAVLSAPWHGFTGARLALGAAGLAGTVYGILVGRRARRTKNYQPVLEDWLGHVIVPSAAYLMLLLGALMMLVHTTDALFAIAGATLVLLFVGIHNAWDTVTYLAVEAQGTETRSG
jgi:hypothetical protein